MRKIFGFHGGVKPPANKQQSVRTPIGTAGIPPELVLPLSQHTGAPTRPVVAVGDRVLKGQLIAAAHGLVSAPLHAPTSGTISAIEDRLIAHPSGLPGPCIVIATDGQDKWIEHSGTRDYKALDKAELINRVRNAGIAGLGGAGFPNAVKLSIGENVQIATLIINGTECEPYITADEVLMRMRADQIIEGADILQHIIAPLETLIAVEDNKPESLAALRSAALGTAIEIVEIPSKYPSGGEKQLIQILTGKEVPSGGLPSDVGVVCQNIGSTAAIFDAVIKGHPLISRITTVTGESVREPQNFEVLIGTPLRYLLDKAGYMPQKNNRLIIGGSMMGFTVPHPDVPIVKTTNCVLAPTESELPTPPPAQACIRCGHCAQACPASLLPQQLFWFARGREVEKLEQHHLFDCIECGACAYVCPSNIPLVQYYRAAKADILQLRSDRAMATQSRMRFEARQQRLARAEVEKEAKRVARKQAAAQRAAPAAGGEEDPIQAAIERSRAKKAAHQAARAGQELDSLEQAVVSAHQRLATATAKLAEAEAGNTDLVEALQAGIAKTRAKLAAAEAALRTYRQSHPDTRSAQPAPDSARAAIDKALAARAIEAALSPADKARADIKKLQQRLRKSQAMLFQSRKNGDEEKVIVALEATVARLNKKISVAQQQLDAAKDT